jgi:hypothetical protein
LRRFTDPESGTGVNLVKEGAVEQDLIVELQEIGFDLYES